ncbi:YtxH domain-containing protein [Serpentinicella alkaliphila]|uniref:Gas vesicle protein n=1 Tax=Serpentinicella alkaliphila TaxID=1734049 RepID=A0A4R2TGP8_9FIRM|nr:YtxH domain-containing protein [Serpentinicella alkaliphila]QUH24619.1 YtxH domain-containing protein [Serpentinicella alkaliphila]TCQ02618.1 gas vesicle protein [Serpentinicella alkaliphila]
MDIRKLQRRAENLRNLLDYNRYDEIRMIERERERRRGVRNGLILGSIIGGLVGVLFAPDTGANTRKKTKEELDRLKGNLEVGIEEGKEKLSEIYEDKKEVIENKIIAFKDKGNADTSFSEVCVDEELEDF